MTLIGLVISVATFFVAINFKKGIAKYNERVHFQNNKKELADNFLSIGVQMDAHKRYDIELITDILTETVKFQTKYTFISQELNKQLTIILKLSNNIRSYGINNNKEENRVNLYLALMKLSELIIKEEVFI